MSLDGYIAAPPRRSGQGLGEDGMRLHTWAFDDPFVFERVYGNLVEETGVVIMGRRSYDNSIEAWGGKGSLGQVPCFVITHRPLASADPILTFVTDGIEAALANAQDANRSYQTIIPDLLLDGRRDDVRSRLPVDAKYKVYDEHSITPEDVYQAFMYSYAFSAKSRTARAAIAYPASADPVSAGS